MRIGIVTLPLWGNYGGILQNYALQEVLRSLGHEPITLDFQWGRSGLPYLLTAAKRIVTNLLGKTHASWHIPYAPTRTVPEVIGFVDQYISHTRTFWNSYPHRIVKEYGLEALIVGSDQVWRPTYTPCIEDMFLKFARDDVRIKLSYAASFGTSGWDFTEAQRAECSRLLARFNDVSVREVSGLPLAEKLGRKATLVQDPTLLLGREGFEKLIGPTSHTDKRERYIATYILDPTLEIEDKVKFLKPSGASLKEITEDMPGVGPKEWIEIICNARFIITNSFHCTIFCLLFHIPFIALVNERRGGSARIESLLTPLGLTDRLFRQSDFYTLAELPESDQIDWDNVDSILAEERQKSMDFLKRNLPPHDPTGV